MWDVGGQDKLRPLWRSYTRCTDGIIFVVDSTKTDRFEEAKLELLKICKSTHKQTSIPVLILANKQDLPVAIEANKLESLLGLKELGPSVLWHLQPTCAVTGEGLDEGMDILHEMILENRRKRRQLQTHSKPHQQRKKVRRSLSHYHWRKNGTFTHYLYFFGPFHLLIIYTDNFRLVFLKPHWVVNLLRKISPEEETWLLLLLFKSY